MKDMTAIRNMLPKRPDGSVDVDKLRAMTDLDTIWAEGHQLIICGASTGTWKTIAMCDTAERAKFFAEIIRAARTRTGEL